MSNHALLWSSIIIPWFTLFLLKRDDIKRYMPVALLGSLLTTIFCEMAIALKWWVVKDAIFPFLHIAPFTYGAFLVGIVWIFKLSYGRFWQFLLINAVFEYILSFPVGNLLVQRGILEYVNISQWQLVAMNLVNAAVLYAYQMWQAGVLIRSELVSNTMRLQPAVAKPLNAKKDERSETSDD